MPHSDDSLRWNQATRQTLHLCMTRFNPALSEEQIMTILRKVHPNDFDGRKLTWEKITNAYVKDPKYKPALRRNWDEIKDEDNPTEAQKAARKQERDTAMVEIRRVMAAENIVGTEIDAGVAAQAGPSQQGQGTQEAPRASSSTVSQFSGIPPTSAGCPFCKQSNDRANQIHPVPMNARDFSLIPFIDWEINGEKCVYLFFTDASDRQHFGWVTEQTMEDIEVS